MLKTGLAALAAGALCCATRETPRSVWHEMWYPLARTVMLGLTVAGIGGCVHVRNLFVQQRAIDFEETPTGIVFLDTPRMWEEFVLTTEGSIEQEADEVRVGKGWDAWWCDAIAARWNGQENPERYVLYILRRREEEGLPPLSCAEEAMRRAQLEKP